LGLQFLKFSTILYDFSKLQLKHIKGQDSILHKGPGNFLKFTTLPSALTLRHLQDCDLHTPALSGGAELAAGEVGPELANKWPKAPIGLTRDRLEVVAGPVMSPASGSDGEVEARSRRSNSGEGGSAVDECVARLGPRCPMEGARWVPRLGEHAEVRARQWLPGGGRGSSGSGEQVARLRQHAGV
jgi:hypothetical protein